MWLKYTHRTSERAISFLIDEAASHRADVVISTAEDNLEEVVADVTEGRGAYACLDVVGGEQCQSLMHCLRVGGTLHLYGERLHPHLLRASSLD